jgi:hypothetical protein
LIGGVTSTTPGELETNLQTVVNDYIEFTHKDYEGKTVRHVLEVKSWEPINIPISVSSSLTELNSENNKCEVTEIKVYRCGTYSVNSATNKREMDFYK